MHSTLTSSSLTQQPQASIRNFSIIAHIDHGKTTLTDRFLRLTGTVDEHDFRERMMDSNPIERERGITIKLAPVRMNYQGYILNLIDTPGHVDFGYEVSRSLAACEGVLLVIDATQGIQAQTLTNYEKAQELGLKIIPVINKIDLPAADPDSVILEAMETFGIDESGIVSVSAKTGLNTEALLQAVMEHIPAPTGDPAAPLRALIITSKFDQHRGTIAYVRVVDGELSAKKLHLIAGDFDFSPLEVGVFSPQMQPVDVLRTGEVGYVATGLKDIRQLKVGDTMTTAGPQALTVAPLPGYREPTPMVYMELYPIDGSEYAVLVDSVSKLAMHDAALQFSSTHSTALGNGLRMGFLGILHAEIVLERLRREFDMELIATAPTVPYRLTLSNGEVVVIHTPAEMPDPSQVRQIEEPVTSAVIFTPEIYLSSIMKLIKDRRGELIGTSYVGNRSRVELKLPLSEIITDLHDTLKSQTAGFASLEYELAGYAVVDAVKVSVLLNHEAIEPLSFMAVRDQAQTQARQLCEKLKDVIPRQQFEIPIQAAIGGTVIARETIKAYRKDVTAKLYGGDVTRRMKLLNKQARGKKRMRQFGKVELNQDAFLAVLKR